MWCRTTFKGSQYQIVLQERERNYTYGSLDISTREASRKGSRASVEGRRDRDNIGAVDEGGRLAEELELVHGGLELGLHAGLVVCSQCQIMRNLTVSQGTY